MDIEKFRNLPEKLRRLVLGQEAAKIGRGGVSQIARKYKVSRTTVTTGKKEYLAGEKYSSKTGSRKPGGGRKPINDHDFGEQRVTPYGIYDYGRNKGFINLGTSSDTAEFAVESIRRWWQYEGSSAYPGCKHILWQITAAATVQTVGCSRSSYLI